MNLKLLKTIEEFYGKKAFKVEDKGSSYKIVFNDNSIMTLFKPELFDKQMQEIRKKSMESMSKCPTKTLKEIKRLCEININDEPLVSSYLDRSCELSFLLEKAYKEIGERNPLHYFIKEISPNIYGKAQTFLKRVTELLSMIEEVLSFKEVEALIKRKGLKIVRREK